MSGRVPISPRPFGLAIVGACLALLLCAQSVGAAEVSLRGFQLRLLAPGDQANIIDVTINQFGYDIADAQSRLRAESPCTSPTPHRVRCVALVSGIRVDLGQGNDEFVATEVDVPLEIDAGTGDDYVAGGSAGDSIVGGEGSDTLDGSAGEDRLVGEAEADSLLGGRDADVIDGGEGIDFVRGQEGNDVGIGGTDDDLLAGASGDDTINGQSGNDGVFDSAGVNRLEGGPDNDILGSTGSQNSTADCGVGTDLLAGNTLMASDGCDSRTDPMPFPEQWPLADETTDVRALASCHFIDCPNRMHVSIHRPTNRPRYFTVKVKDKFYSRRSIVVWSVNRRGTRVGPYIRRSRWPTNTTKKLRRPAPPEAAFDGRGQLP
jgi:hypothetical protein